MGIQRKYESLPFSWEGKSQQAYEQDKRWLEGILRNAARFSDAWTKARIVQLAHKSEIGSEQETYPGLSSETAIVRALRGLCPLSLYPGFATEVDEDFVIKTLNSWRMQRFSQVVSRNFEVYASWQYDNVFLVTSTAAVTLEVDRPLPPLQNFRALFNVNELAWLMRDRGCHHLTLRTHGYASPAQKFFQAFAREAKALNSPTSPQEDISLQHFYIGYQWPSEQPIFSPELWFDFRHNLGITVKFVLVLITIASIVGTLLYALLPLGEILLFKALENSFGSPGILAWSKTNIMAALQFNWLGIVGTVFLLWALAFHLLRILVYQRDRNRATNYGAPDLAEFFWRLDKALDKPGYWPQTLTTTFLNAAKFKNYTLKVNLIGHSMGALVTLTLLRILSDRFGKDDQESVLSDFIPTLRGRELVSRGPEQGDRIGQYLQLDKLILVSPDIPLEFIREGRNNYMRSAISRCRQIYVLSSDRDIVLRYLSTLGNWFSEPSIQMSGLRLGNVFLQKLARKGPLPQYYPVIRNLLTWRSVATETSAYDLFEKINYLDCSEVSRLNGMKLPLLPATALLIDLGNMVLFFLGRIDVHSGYFATNTSTFRVLQFLMMTEELCNDKDRQEIEQLITSTPIRFLPSQPFLSKQLS